MLLDRLQRPVRGVRIVRKGSIDSDDTGCVQIVPMRPLTREDVDRLMSRLPNSDDRIVTSALSVQERQVFLDAGFSERESLHLLRHDLAELPITPTVDGFDLRAGRRGDLTQVLSIDQKSFDDFWALDREGLNAARKATPIHRYTVATIANRVVGYAVTGRSETATFLQRLGIDPAHRRKGIGSMLVVDALRWARQHGGTTMLVNTQTRNEQALHLYTHLGFKLADEQLKVLEWSADDQSLAQ